jgi:hypothetical protein
MGAGISSAATEVLCPAQFASHYSNTGALSQSGRRRRQVDLATDFVDLAQLQTLAAKVDKAYANRFERHSPRPTAHSELAARRGGVDDGRHMELRSSWVAVAAPRLSLAP